ncbi:ParB/RepB/Spo0J family partition protein [Streptomyces sp. CHD11]|uniref:ParB/RepB/Spo0J family partition protein n=1 Tax=Streptomyces sp. CHD11 TaxID=2741325 RepID=UPI001BFC0214|nr:ParB/RepB/Spo0J family partition protein [Streptomyces sp. CHD11]MBT3151339.1 ParB/RepB/Spo0J family partition protein [Streptomyces sp. CHD11]
MSKAEQLGAGRFSGGARPVSARRQAVAAATGVPTDGVAPPSALSPDRISLNPDNPRSSLGDLTDLAGSLKTHGQKQAITVMNRDAYIKANPAREGDLERDTAYVVIDGSSRLAAAREAGLATVRVMVSDDQGETSEELLESALVANIHRQDLGELDEARALQRLLVIHGSQSALAKRLHRSQGWVSQRLALLNLTPELQARMGEEPIDLLRAVGNKPAAEQEAALQELKLKRARKEAEKQQRRDGAEAQRDTGPQDGGAPENPASYYDVIGAAAPTAPPTPPATASPTASPTAPAPAAEQSPAGQPHTHPVPEPRADASAPEARAGARGTAGAAGKAPAPASGPAPAAEERRAPQVPYGEPGSLAMLLDKKIEDDDIFFQLLQFLGMKATTRDPARLQALARTFAEQPAARAE